MSGTVQELGGGVTAIKKGGTRIGSLFVLQIEYVGNPSQFCQFLVRALL